MCTDEIEARFTMNDPNENRVQILRGPSVSILSRSSFVFIVKVKLRLTFCIDQFMVNAKFV
ncbi:hypothetical protein HanRHA438_Chr15g0722261 [Helianthus annuus]|nr:hypothetical protein HanRHA438_Chr15g0722261 [Helianthus annuus]